MRLALGLLMCLLAGCGPTAVSTCHQQCDKAASCGMRLDTVQCGKACDGATLPGSEACQKATLALEQCQLRQSCADYRAGQGCDAESAQVVSDCR